MNIKKILTNAQAIGVIIMLTGLICEIITKADWGWLIFTCGSVYFTIATKIKYHRKRRD